MANVDYLASRLRPDSIVMRVLEEVRLRGTVVDSQEIPNDYFCSEFERWARLLDPRDDGIDPDDGTLYTERNFYSAFFADLRKSIREIIIVSPFLAAPMATSSLTAGDRRWVRLVLARPRSRVHRVPGSARWT